MFSTIAVGTDGSATASEAVRGAAEIARRHESSLVLLSAFQNAPSPKADEDIEVQWASSSSARMQSMLEQTAAELGQEGIDCRTLSGEGDPAEVLVRLAADCGADLLVIGNKGMKRRVLGSVPNTVTHKAECSVLVIKTT